MLREVRKITAKKKKWASQDAHVKSDGEGAGIQFNCTCFFVNILTKESFFVCFR